MSTYGDLARELRELFASDLFSDATIERTGGNFDPRLRKVVPAAGSVLPCRVQKETSQRRDVDGALSTVTTFMLNIEPRISDKINLKGNAFRVTGFDTEDPDGVPLYWTAEVER